jgi:hypothetical protein
MRCVALRQSAICRCAACGVQEPPSFETLQGPGTFDIKSISGNDTPVIRRGQPLTTLCGVWCRVRIHHIAYERAYLPPGNF